MMRHKIHILLLIILALLPTAGFAEILSGMVVEVIDGDTIDILYQSQTQRIRLGGIDAPEKGQAFGSEAKRFVIDLAGRRYVTVAAEDTDRYGRIIGEVILPDGRSLNREIVKEGYAWWYRKYSRDVSIGYLEEAAKISGKGLWQGNDPIPPWAWRKGARVASNLIETKEDYQQRIYFVTAITELTNGAGSSFGYTKDYLTTYFYKIFRGLQDIHLSGNGEVIILFVRSEGYAQNGEITVQLLGQQRIVRYENLQEFIDVIKRSFAPKVNPYQEDAY